GRRWRRRRSRSTTATCGTRKASASPPASSRGGSAQQAADAPAQRVEALGPRRDAIAEGGGLRFGRRRVVAHLQELDAPLRAVEDGALGVLARVLALRIDRARIDEMQVLAVKQNLSPGQLERVHHVRLIDRIDPL